MRASLALAGLAVFINLAWCGVSRAQESAAPTANGRARGPRGDREGRGRPLFGKISAIGKDSIEVTGPDGTKTTLALTGSTEFRKDRQPAKLADFSVGDPVVVRTDQLDGKGTTALLVASGQFGMRNGGREAGGPGFGGGMLGTLGKDYVAGEVKSVDPPRLAVVRTDSVNQTLELNEETSLRRGRDSITMAEIKAGDHVIARGAVENNVFVPKHLTVFSPEQWERIEEMISGGGPGSPSVPAVPVTPAAPATPPKPPEPQN